MLETGRIDVHHHLLTDFYIKAQQKAGISGTAYRGFPEWTPQHSLSVMENEGIATTILSFTSPGIWFLKPLLWEELQYGTESALMAKE